MNHFISCPEVRQADRSDEYSLIYTLARAFNSDPVAKFCVRTDSGRDWAMRIGFKHVLKLYRPHHLTFTVSNGKGVSLWARHDQWQFTFKQECTLIPIYMCVSGGIKRFIRLIKGFNTTKSHHPSEPRYYLYLLGVHPDYQSQGLGTALMSNMLDRCDRERMPAYFEATSPLNIKFCRRQGFRITKEFQFGLGGPILKAIWPDPSTDK